MYAKATINGVLSEEGDLVSFNLFIKEDERPKLDNNSDGDKIPIILAYHDYTFDITGNNADGGSIFRSVIGLADYGTDLGTEVLLQPSNADLGG